MTAQCPLCEREFPNGFKFRLLNSVPVCKKCRNGFANRRQFAYIIDSILWNIVLVPVWMVIEYFLYGASSFRPTNPFVLASPTGPVAEVVLSFGFTFLFFLKDGLGGLSPGRRLMGIQVVDVETMEPIGFLQSFKRNLVLLVPFSVLIVAASMMKGQRWGDKWAKTKVVWLKYKHKLVFDPRGIVCTCCGYDLTGNVTGRCPECFTPTGMPSDDTNISEAIPVARAIT